MPAWTTHLHKHTQSGVNLYTLMLSFRHMAITVSHTCTHRQHQGVQDIHTHTHRHIWVVPMPIRGSHTHRHRQHGGLSDSGTRTGVNGHSWKMPLIINHAQMLAICPSVCLVDTHSHTLSLTRQCTHTYSCTVYIYI